MNKKMIALFLAGIMLLFVGCGKDDVDPNETTSSTENQMDTEATGGNESLETVPGTAQNVLDPDGFEEAAEDDNSGASTGNNGSSGNGQSNTGNGNTGNTGNSVSSGNNEPSGNNSGSTGGEGQSNSGSENAGNNTGNSDNNGNTGNSGGDNAEQTTEPESTEPSSGIQYVSYETYNSMTSTEQVAYYNQFPSMEAFVKWYNEAKAAYDAEHGSIEVGDGNIDLGGIAKP